MSNLPEYTYMCPNRGAFRPHVMSRNGMVTAGHYLAARWGAEMLQRGGNAADAGVAAGLVLNVVHNDMASLSGVAPVIFFDCQTQTVNTLSGVGRWPATVDLDTLRAEYGDNLPPGVKRAVVPAAADAWLTALEKFGTFSWQEVSEYPIHLAREGFPVHHFLASNIAGYIDGYRRWPENARIYLRNGKPPAPGDILQQPELGNLLHRLGQAEADAAAGSDGREQGLDAARDLFYRGDIASNVVQYYREQGGMLSEEDFAAFRVGNEPPIAVSFGDLDVWGCGPWCQGPVLLMALNTLRHFDLPALEPGGPQFLHLVVEALKLAFADLEAHCGDPEFVDVPMEELLSPEYGALRAELIDLERAFPGVPPYGDPVAGAAAAGRLPEAQHHGEDSAEASEPDTSFVCVIDEQGNVFSATPSDGYSGNPIVPGLGIHVSSRGVQSRLDPDHPNCLAPQKRPRLTPNPAIVTRQGEPHMALGTPGNNRQPQAMLQALLYMEVFDMPPQQAVETPRVATYSFPGTSFPHTYEPGLLRVEATIPEKVRRDLQHLGHRIEVVPPWTWSMGGVCVVRRDRASGVLWGGADPRRETYSVGF